MENRIYYNIGESDYIFKSENFEYYFSSLLYRNKFAERYMKNRENLQYKLTSRYNIEFLANDYFDIILYHSVEKRGFKVISIKSGECFKCLSEIKLNGEIKTLGN